jgi:sialate O-acetylesterase
MFNDGMVIQQGAAFPVRGCSLPFSAVIVTFLGESFQTQTDADGKWQLTLDPVQAGGPFTMVIESAEEKICIKDIYSGGVWLCAGQSNMELPMQRLRDNYPEEWTAEAFPPIRQFKVPQEWDFSGPREELGGGIWTAATADTLHEFSGTAWFFAKSLYEKYHLPIGLISTGWGGTPIEAWMSREALAAFPEKIAQGEQYADPALCKEIGSKSEAAIQEWEGKLAREDQGLMGKWQSPQTDLSKSDLLTTSDLSTSGWNDITLPGDFAEAGLVDFCGVVWLCREFDVKSEFAEQEARVWLGTIVDADTVYINGDEVGNITYRYPPRKYRIPAGLLCEGKNRIVIRVNCVNGQGGITKDKPFRVFSEKGCIELAGTWKYRIGAKAPPRPEAFFFQRQPMGPFNAMIAPILKFPLRGVIWYQGESNDPEPDTYAALFKAMIQDWRNKYALRNKSGQDDLPFLFVQLPIFGSPAENDETASWAIIREAQSAALSLPATGMAAALDLGEWNDLHPLNKKEVGRRLLLAAEQVVFKNKNAPGSPMCRSIKLNRNKLFLTFDNCGGGLTARETPYVSVIAGGTQVRLPAKIEGADTISVDISSIKNENKKPEKILYAWANNPKDRQLYNSEGLPVVPFRVEIPS